MSETAEGTAPSGQESVWDYPRPPRLEPVAERLRVVFAGRMVAETEAGFRVLETSHPPVYYIPYQDVRLELLHPAEGHSLCEFKGIASYWSLHHGDRAAERAAWGFFRDRHATNKSGCNPVADGDGQTGNQHGRGGSALGRELSERVDEVTVGEDLQDERGANRIIPPEQPPFLHHQ